MPASTLIDNNTTTYLNFDLVSGIISSKDISVLLDAKLNYLLVNKAACDLLNKSASELIGRSIIDLYPSMIASANHRNLLKALNGEMIRDYELISNDKKFMASYIPVFEKKTVIGVLSKATFVR